MIKFAPLIKLFTAGALALGLGGGSLAQEPDKAKGTTVTAIVALEFKSHDEGMKNISFHNPDQRLNLEDMTELPFQWVDNGAEPLRMSDLIESAEALAELLETHGIAYDSERPDGFCDMEIMRKYNSSDLLCKPSRVPPPAMVFLALFHPQTSEPLAITSYIDNSFGGAVKLRPASPAPGAGAGKGHHRLQSGAMGEAGRSQFQRIQPGCAQPAEQCHLLSVSAGGGRRSVLASPSHQRGRAKPVRARPAQARRQCCR